MASAAELVRELRDRTGAGVMDCKAALDAAQGDMQGAVEFLRKPVSQRTGRLAP